MKNIIKFKLGLQCLKGGKKDGINEDNYFLDANLSDKIGLNNDEPIFETDKLENLSDFGMLMVVADGMGGMNAGEVASKIACETAGEFFAHENLTEEIVATHKSRCNYMERTIIEANKRILKDQQENSEHSGMGSTMVMAWLVNGELSVSWIGDSRAYLWSKREQKLKPISKDHSYVQSLVDEGKISYEQSFTHPQGNIVTKSLGDPDKEAVPESAEIQYVEKGDIILLCSDGLCGVLFDNNARIDGYPISDYNIEDIIIANQNSDMKTIVGTLVNAAKNSNWYDNCTVVVCRIEEFVGGEKLSKTADDIVAEKRVGGDTLFKVTRSTMKTGAFIFAILVLVGIIGWLIFRGKESNKSEQLIVKNYKEQFSVQVDSLRKTILDTLKLFGRIDTLKLFGRIDTLLMQDTIEEKDTAVLSEINLIKQKAQKINEFLKLKLEKKILDSLISRTSECKDTAELAKIKDPKIDYGRKLKSLIEEIGDHPYLGELKTTLNKESQVDFITYSTYSKYEEEYNKLKPIADFLKELDNILGKENNENKKVKYQEIKNRLFNKKDNKIIVEKWQGTDIKEELENIRKH